MTRFAYSFATGFFVVVALTLMLRQNIVVSLFFGSLIFCIVYISLYIVNLHKEVTVMYKFLGLSLSSVLIILSHSHDTKAENERAYAKQALINQRALLCRRIGRYLEECDSKFADTEAYKMWAKIPLSHVLEILDKDALYLVFDESSTKEILLSSNPDDEGWDAAIGEFPLHPFPEALIEDMRKITTAENILAPYLT